jgi:hypothetical protein
MEFCTPFTGRIFVLCATLRRVTMASQDFCSFIEPRILSSKSIKSPSDFIESPVRGLKHRIEGNLVVSPHRQIKRRGPSDFIAPPVSTVPAPIKTSSKKRDIPDKGVKPRKKRHVQPISPIDHNDGFDDDSGGFGDWSPEDDHEVKDTIDWSIAGDEIEMLKSKVIPIYWEFLLETANSVVRVTERLYILQDWNRLGYLMVTDNYIRLISLGTPV